MHINKKILFFIVIVAFAFSIVRLTQSDNRKDANRSLLNAAALGDITQAQTAIKSGANIDITLREKNYETPLIMAVKAGHVDMVKFLIKKGASKAIANSKNETAESIAKATDNTELKEALGVK